MIVTSLRPVGCNWSTLSYASTLYMKPILDLLLTEVPSHWQAELRLGLQEALVNAVKHGNQLDPSKLVIIQFSVVSQQYWWVVTDQGSGINPGNLDGDEVATKVPCYDAERGRGLYILHQVFDQVVWNHCDRQLHLCKQMGRYSMPAIP